MKKAGRRITIVVVCLTFMVGLAISGWANRASAAESVITIKLTSHLAPSFCTSIADQKWADLVTKRTNGRVKFQIFPASQLFSGEEAFNAISKNKIGGGTISETYFGGIRPEWDYVNVPFLMKDWAHIWRAWDAGWKDIITPAYEANNLHQISPAYATWMGIGGSRDFKMPSDLKGARIRVMGKLQNAWVSALGGAPVSMASSEMYLAMQLGTIDGFITPHQTITARHLEEVTKFWGTTSPFFNSYPMALNKQLWDSLPKDVQDIMTVAGKEIYRDWLTNMQQEADAAAFKAMTKKRVKLVDLTAAEFDAWSKASAPVEDIYLKTSGSLGQKMLEIADKTAE